MGEKCSNAACPVTWRMTWEERHDFAALGFAERKIQNPSYNGCYVTDWSSFISMTMSHLTFECMMVSWFPSFSLSVLWHPGEWRGVESRKLFTFLLRDHYWILFSWMKVVDTFGFKYFCPIKTGATVSHTFTFSYYVIFFWGEIHIAYLQQVSLFSCLYDIHFLFFVSNVFIGFPGWMDVRKHAYSLERDRSQNVCT